MSTRTVKCPVCKGKGVAISDDWFVRPMTEEEIVKEKEKGMDKHDATEIAFKNGYKKAWAEAEQVIKELTEENTKLTINMNAYGLATKRLGEENEKLRAENAEQDRAIIRILKQMGEIRRETEFDIVRKMQECIAEHATNGYPRKIRLDVIDQIAKEMLAEVIE